MRCALEWIENQAGEHTRCVLSVRRQATIRLLCTNQSSVDDLLGVVVDYRRSRPRLPRVDKRNVCSLLVQTCFM